MRVGSVILCGLAAGLFINLSGLTEVHFVLGPEYVNALLSHLPHPTGPATLVRHLSVRFGLGILCIALFAALRPRFDLGTTAAVTAGAFLFFAAYVPLSVMFNELGLLAGWRLWAALLWGLAEALIATLLGSHLYEKLTG
jgi:hypothetical protein